MGVLSYCIHRTDDRTELVVPIDDARAAIQAAALAAWKLIPMRQKLTGGQLDRAIVAAVDAALDDGLAALQRASAKV